MIFPNFTNYIMPPLCIKIPKVIALDPTLRFVLQITLNIKMSILNQTRAESKL